MKLSNTKKPGFTFSDEELQYLMHHQSLKLQIELVPMSCFWSNVRSKIKIGQWDKIRKVVYQRANNKCEICGGQGIQHPVECHEVWSYDETNMIQRLSHFQCICPQCHEVKHLGRTSSIGNGERAFSRFIEINKIDENIAHEISRAIWKQWVFRSKKQWKLDIEHLKEWNIDTNYLPARSDKILPK